MEKECNSLKKMKRTLKISFITFVLIVLSLILLYIHRNKIAPIFYNDNGVFSNEVLWSAIGSIGSILAIIGVIVTIKYTEYSRHKQNEYEYNKQRLLDEILEFKKEVIKQLDILGSLRIVTFDTGKDWIETGIEINTYIAQINSIHGKIYWYYNRNMTGNYKELNAFIIKLNSYIDYMQKKLIEYNNCLLIYKVNDKYKIYIDMEKAGLMTPTEKEDFELLKRGNPNLFEQVKDVPNKISSIKESIIEYRNNNWNILEEQAKLMVEEYEKNRKYDLK